MKSLRNRMIQAMVQRGFSPRTHESYLAAISALAKHYHQSPEMIQVGQIQQYFDYLVQQRHLSGSTCRLYLNAIRFLFLQVLHESRFDIDIQMPKRQQKIPELLTHTEVKKIIEACENNKHKMMMLTCYACGLRVSELVCLKVRNIDSERHLLRIEQGKGSKDRAVYLPSTLIHQLRNYWRKYHPRNWLFSKKPTSPQHLSITTAQNVFNHAKKQAKIIKKGGIHALRHAYATHQLEAGLPINQLQQQLGHQNLQSTLRYLHWIPQVQKQGISIDDLAKRVMT